MLLGPLLQRPRVDDRARVLVAADELARRLAILVSGRDYMGFSRLTTPPADG